VSNEAIPELSKLRLAYFAFISLSIVLLVKFCKVFVIFSISQFHHLSSKSFEIISSENCFFISFAGFPPTIAIG
jgi:hypothetical protein